MEDSNTKITTSNVEFIDGINKFSGIFIRYVSKRNVKTNLIVVSVLLTIMSSPFIIANINNDNSDGSGLKFGLIIFSIALLLLLIAIFGLRNIRPGNKFEGILSAKGKTYVGKFRINFNEIKGKEIFDSIEMEDDESPKLIEINNDIIIKVNLFLSSGSNYIKSVTVNNFDSSENLITLEYDEFERFREKECIRLIDNGTIIRNSTFFRNEIINFIDPIISISKELFPNNNIKYILEISIIKSNYSNNALFFGLLGLIYSEISDSIKKRNAINDFLNGQIELSNGDLFSDYCEKNNWEVKFIS